MRPLETPCEQFLKANPSKKILLAFSGGSDSTALFHVLNSLKNRLGFELGLAHVDHRWREESAQEARIIEKLAALHQVPLFLKVLDPALMQGSLEEASRNARLLFFKEIIAREGFDYLALAHHADDQAETVLKRLFEGASFQTLGSMKMHSEYEGMKVWRPWLHVSKQEILAFLQTNALPYFEDATNGDLTFLRGRMRKVLMPTLQEAFGKNIRSSLLKLGEGSEELNEWLRERYSPILDLNPPWNRFLDLSEVTHSFEARWLIREWLGRQKITPSYECLKILTELSLEGVTDRYVELSGYEVHVDRKCLFCLKKFLPPKGLIECNKHVDTKWGEWRIKGEEESSLSSLTGWKNAWEGALRLAIPEQKYWVGGLSDLPSIEVKRKIQKQLSSAKIPAFLRRITPLILMETGEVITPLLPQKIKSGRSVAMIRPSL